MSVLILKFKDENGDEQVVEVDGGRFTIGRHSESDLTYIDGRLSREHVRFERKGTRFTVADLESSNGTKINGESLYEPRHINNGDVLNLGGALEIEIAIRAVDADQNGPIDVNDGPGVVPEGGLDISGEVPAALSAMPASAVEPAAEGIPTALFIIAPLLGVFVLAFVIGAVFLLGGDKKEISANDDNGYAIDVEKPISGANDDATPKPIKTTTTSPTPPPNNGPANSASPAGTDLPNGGTGENAKVEQNGSVFIRQIAQNDPKAFLTGDQAAAVGAKVKLVERSPALADNINSARRNAAAIKTLASKKNLKPQFLAVAAITKLGSNRGDVLQAAASVADVYEKLGIHIGSENFDDALLMVAAYDQGAAGETMKMRNMLQDLAAKTSEGARTVRSIWFLQKAGKITSAEYDRAITFLAIGTISQNPKDFGVNAEALRL